MDAATHLRGRWDADQGTDMLVLLLSVEIGLRILTDGTHAIMGAIRRRRGSTGTDGFWRSLAGLVGGSSSPAA